MKGSGDNFIALKRVGAEESGVTSWSSQAVTARTARTRAPAAQFVFQTQAGSTTLLL